MNPNEAQNDIEDLFKDGDENEKRLKIKANVVKKKLQTKSDEKTNDDYDEGTIYLFN
jgi:hypothetical protein